MCTFAFLVSFKIKQQTINIHQQQPKNMFVYLWEKLEIRSAWRCLTFDVLIHIYAQICWVKYADRELDTIQS